PARPYGRLLVMPGATAPVAVAPKGRQVCTCFNVTEPQIQASLQRGSGSAEEQLARLQGELRCGTHCGSCVPELRKLIGRQIQPA
ncbi:MAG TPA: (2Fe-2S)-binding protein, partial [Burkholderiaceae bacterium]|nr:(2Fe-2S)-binding protein [Burkholderiaceae bacterium]